MAQCSSASQPASGKTTIIRPVATTLLEAGVPAALAGLLDAAQDILVEAVAP